MSVHKYSSISLEIAPVVFWARKVDPAVLLFVAPIKLVCVI